MTPTLYRTLVVLILVVSYIADASLASSKDLLPTSQTPHLTQSTWIDPSARLLRPPQIINGQPTSPGEFKEFTLLLTKSPDESTPKITCSAVLIAPTKVLTAAHCISPNPSIEHWVIPSYHSYKDLSTPANLIRVSELAVHPNYDSSNLENDIAILTLEKVVTGQKAILFRGNERLIDVPATVVGSGVIDEHRRTLPKVLQKMTSAIDNNTNCNRWWDFFFDVAPVKKNMLCIKAVRELNPYEPSPCFGDSGGPLFVNINNRRTVAGLTSFASPYGCDGLDPTVVFTRVSSHYIFISSQAPNAQFARLPGPKPNTQFLPSIILPLMEESPES